MVLVRWNPWREMNSLQRHLNRSVDLAPSSTSNRWSNLTQIPAAELQVTDSAIALKLEIPGIDAKDLDIQVTENAVLVKGERKSETKSEANGITRSEFHYGSFRRVIPLPTHIQKTQVQAEYKDGILHLTLPKMEAEQPSVVKVNLTEQAA